MADIQNPILSTESTRMDVSSCLNKLKGQIETAMNSCADTAVPRPLGIFLYVLSRVYGAAISLRTRLYQQGVLRRRKVRSIVISVGNITVGGTGKTPMTVYLAELLRRWGYKVVILSRGYGGTGEVRGGIVGDGKEVRMDAVMAGDEPYMMACKLSTTPVLVGKQRFELATVAVEKFGAQIVLLDDGFQHVQLARDLDIVLLDAVRPFGNGHLLPRGMMREPAGQLRRADIVILTRSVEGPSSVGLDVPLPLRAPVFHSVHMPDFIARVPSGSDDLPDKEFERTDRFDPQYLDGRRVLAFSGIGNNESFRKTAESLGADIGGFLAFSDHHRYTQQDVETILRAARDAETDALLTTEKDYFRMAGHLVWPVDLLVLGIAISFGEQEAAFISCLQNVLSRGRETPVRGLAGMSRPTSVAPP